MQCPKVEGNAIIIAEMNGGHKVVVKNFPPGNNHSELFRDMDFKILMEYDIGEPNYCTSYKAEYFLPLHLARLVLVSHFGACGYKCFASVLGNSRSLMLHLMLFNHQFI